MKLVKNIQTVAREVLQLEAKSIEELANHINDDFEACIKSIFESKGRVVVTGIGKSANIGSKIVSTLNSTGTPALFMHAADAIHGDLGMVQKDDIIICISNSGNTPEIKVLVPLVQNLGAKMVAMVGNDDSYLAKQADHVLNTSVEREADPNNLAPTCSTTATLAMGDAVAVCLIVLRDFKESDFARFHPGGALGKKLYLRVEDLVHSEKPMVEPNSSIADTILEISTKRLGATSVVENGKLVGIITDGDLRRMLNSGLDIQKAKAKDIMGKNPKSIEKSAYAVNAMQIMRDHNITQLVVCEKDSFIGLIHIHDLLTEGIV